jgi:hypothetical protein
VVLAGDLGPAPLIDTVPYSSNETSNLRVPPVPVPVLVRGDEPIEASIVRNPGAALRFHTSGIGRPSDVTLLPFWEISFNRYTVYWNTLTDEQMMYRSALAAREGETGGGQKAPVHP